MNIKVEQAKREDGFTLIELLVVVIIIGILAAIAIPVFLNQRTSAREAAVESTLRSAATYMEINLTESEVYPTTLDPLVAEGFRPGDNITMDDGDVNVTDNDYSLRAAHAGDPAVEGCFRSQTGTPEIITAGGACAP